MYKCYKAIFLPETYAAPQVHGLLPFSLDVMALREEF